MSNPSRSVMMMMMMMLIFCTAECRHVVYTDVYEEIFRVSSPMSEDGDQGDHDRPSCVHVITSTPGASTNLGSSAHVTYQ